MPFGLVGSGMLMPPKDVPLTPLATLPATNDTPPLRVAPPLVAAVVASLPVTPLARSIRPVGDVPGRSATEVTPVLLGFVSPALASLTLPVTDPLLVSAKPLPVSDAV